MFRCRAGVNVPVVFWLLLSVLHKYTVFYDVLVSCLRLFTASSNIRKRLCLCFGHVFIAAAQEMLLSIVDNSGPGFRSSEKFILAVRHYLCDALLLNSTSSNKAVMKLSLKIFKPMCRDFKVCLTAWRMVVYRFRTCVMTLCSASSSACNGL